MKSSNSKNRNAITVVATIDSDDFVGTVTVMQAQIIRTVTQISDAKWEISIDSINADICKNTCDADPDCTAPATMLNWHIHERAIPVGGGCGDAGGHWDPTFGCGGASQYQPTLCGTITTDVPGRVNPQSCDPTADIALCEMGDLSSKMGQVMISESTQQFADKYISNLDNIKDLSIVFHCGAPRVACSNFEMM
jgi:hypothetical protein